jgi:hypothetical protein
MARRLMFSESAARSQFNGIMMGALKHKINKDKTKVIYMSRRRIPVEAQLTFNGRNIPFAYEVKYLGVILAKELHGDFK